MTSAEANDRPKGAVFAGTEVAEVRADVETVLGSIAMFRHLGARQRARLAELFCRRTYRADEVVVRQGDTSLSFYVVLSGRVRIVRHSAGDDGRDSVEIVEEGPGSFFGEMGVIDDLPRAATVVALEPTECALLAKWDLQRELGSEPGIALGLISVLNARIRTLEDRLSLAARAAAVGGTPPGPRARTGG